LTKLRPWLGWHHFLAHSVETSLYRVVQTILNRLGVDHECWTDSTGFINSTL